jgi:hypothetical protein
MRLLDTGFAHRCSAQQKLDTNSHARCNAAAVHVARAQIEHRTCIAQVGCALIQLDRFLGALRHTIAVLVAHTPD